MKRFILFLFLALTLNLVSSQEIRALVRPDDYWGVINQKNELIIEPIYRNAEDFILMK